MKYNIPLHIGDKIHIDGFENFQKDVYVMSSPKYKTKRYKRISLITWYKSYRLSDGSVLTIFKNKHDLWNQPIVAAEVYLDGWTYCVRITKLA